MRICFFFYSSWEIIILMVSFYILALIHKMTLIQLVQTINYHQSAFERVGRVPYEELDRELKEYQVVMKDRGIPSELQELSYNLNDFLWIVEFLSRVRNKKQNQVLLQKGLQIFLDIECSEGLEIVYNKLINEYIRQKDSMNAIRYINEFINIQLNHMNYLIKKNEGLESQQDEITKLNHKIFFHINILLNQITKIFKLE